MHLTHAERAFGSIYDDAPQRYLSSRNALSRGRSFLELVNFLPSLQITIFFHRQCVLSKMHAQTTITAVKAAQRLDSRGKPTVQVRVTTLDGVFQAIVPSGASKGDYEAIELRDGDRNAFEGNGVLTAVRNVEDILGPAIMEKKYDVANDLEAIDRHMISMDGTDNKKKLGANAILGISMACTRAAAAANVRPTLMLVKV
jgi:hypothetical protein